MNFLDLYKKIKFLDEGLAPPSGPIQGDGISSYPVEECSECGGDMDMPAHQPHQAQQQDSVNMTVSMNGQGPGGIRDLMNILRNIDDAADKVQHTPAEPAHVAPHHNMHQPHGDDELIIGEPVDSEEEEVMFSEPEEEFYMHPEEEEECNMNFEEEPELEEEEEDNSYANNPDVRKMAVASVVATGDDLASKGNVSAVKKNGGENPLRTPVAETLVNRLRNHYNEVKTGRQN